MKGMGSYKSGVLISKTKKDVLAYCSGTVGSNNKGFTLADIGRSSRGEYMVLADCYSLLMYTLQWTFVLVKTLLFSVHELMANIVLERKYLVKTSYSVGSNFFRSDWDTARGFLQTLTTRIKGGDSKSSFGSQRPQANNELTWSYKGRTSRKNNRKNKFDLLTMWYTSRWICRFRPFSDRRKQRMSASPTLSLLPPPQHANVWLILRLFWQTLKDNLRSNSPTQRLFGLSILNRDICSSNG